MSKIETPSSNFGIENGGPDLRMLRDHELDTVSGAINMGIAGGEVIIAKFVIDGPYT